MKPIDINSVLSERDVARIQDVLIQQLDIARTQITPQARIIEDLGADSLDVAEITMLLEEAFQITIPDEEADNGSTVEDLCAVVARSLSEYSHRQ
jgi:acyl carrier protein